MRNATHEVNIVEYTRVSTRAVSRITIPREIGFMVNNMADDSVISMEDRIISINIL